MPSGPAPKDPSTRARRNTTSTRATLSRTHEVERPPLPDAREWHPKAVAWWSAVWASPMAAEFVDADVPALERLVLLVHSYWCAESTGEMLRLSAEIRLQQVNFGLTPLDRRRLEWSIESAEESKDRGARRRATSPPPKSASAAKDPRNVLKLA